MQKIIRMYLWFCFGGIISLFFAPVGFAECLENAPQPNSDNSCEIWQACSNDYTFLEFLSEVFTSHDKTDINKETTPNTIQKTEQSPPTKNFTNH